MTRKLIAVPLAALALALGACGDDDDDDSGSATTEETTEAAPPTETTPPETEPSGAATKLKADADPGGDLKFTTDSLDAKAGKVTITMANESSLPHAVGIEGNGVDEEGATAQKGGTSEVTAELKPGEYEFYCPVPGHAAGGMKGTLTVK